VPVVHLALARSQRLHVIWNRARYLCGGHVLSMPDLGPAGSYVHAYMYVL
jgi:hypothetical protein